MLKVVSIWQPNLKAAHKFINKYNLGDRLVQFAYDFNAVYGYWCVLKLTEHDVGQLIEKEGHPMLTVIS